MKRLPLVLLAGIGSILVPAHAVTAAPPSCRVPAPEADATTHFADGTEAHYDGNEGTLTTLLGYGVVDDFTGGVLTVHTVLTDPCRGAEYRVDVYAASTGGEPIAGAAYVSDGKEDTPTLVAEVPASHASNCVWVQLTAAKGDTVLDTSGADRLDVCDSGGGGGRTMF